jgi:hypothetical protein
MVVGKRRGSSIPLIHKNMDTSFHIYMKYASMVL